jgi:hypothetical protein
MNRQAAQQLWFYVAALALGIAAVLPFIETNGRLILEPDMPLGDIRLYYDTLAGWSWTALPAPIPNVYFEGHSLIYALAMHLIAVFAGAPADFDAAAAATINVVNAMTSAVAAVVFFATVRRLAVNAAVALLLTAAFVFAPQIVDIDLVRIDRFMLLPLAVILHESIAIARGQPGKGIALGAATAVIAATKVSGGLFAVFAVTAFIIAFLNAKTDDAARRHLLRVFTTTFFVGLVVLAVLMIRFVLHPGLFIAGLKASYDMQMLWTAIFPFTPRLYYNVDLFLGYGVAFLAIAILAIAGCAVQAVRQRDPVAFWLLANLVIFSGLGAAAFKYSRGGYHLVPLYLYAMALAARSLDAWFPRRGLVQAAVMAVVLIPTASAFATSTHIALQRSQSIAATRFAARDWIAAHFAPDARICMMGSSQWASPRLAGLGFHVTTQIFDFPYLDRATMADFIPPRLDQLRAACDGVVFNDLHKNAYVGNFRTFGAAQRLQEWEQLFSDLVRDFPPRVFSAATPAYYVSRVEVYDLRRESPLVDLAAAAAPLSGAVDAAVRYGDRIALQGWAADAGSPAAKIAVTVGERIAGVDGTGTARRPDVAAALKNTSLQTAGFFTCVTLPKDAEGPVRVFAQGRDGSWGRLGADEALTVTDAAPDAPLPTACLSSE